LKSFLGTVENVDTQKLYIQWLPEHQAAFDQLKLTQGKSISLAYYNPTAPTEIIVDASPVGLGAILAQEQPDGKVRPVRFGSRALTDVETRYSQTERKP